VTAAAALDMAEKKPFGSLEVSEFFITSASLAGALGAPLSGRGIQ
jgi:hypothetical protein